MRFAKMHGNANDYIYVNCFSTGGEVVHEADAPALSRFLSDRRMGVGSDGLVLIRPGQTADCRMDMYNADGSRGRMCGNAVRCVGKYVYDRGLCVKPVITVETLSGIKTLELLIENGACKGSRVNMGAPDFTTASIPMSVSLQSFTEQPITAGGRKFQITCVNTGSSHAVAFVDDADGFDAAYYGKLIENHPLFPDRVNVNFVQVISDRFIKTRVWERGSGETFACGSGACASLAVSALLGKTGRQGTVKQRGGELQIEWAESGELFMTGPAEHVFDGEIDASRVFCR